MHVEMLSLRAYLPAARWTVATDFNVDVGLKAVSKSISGEIGLPTSRESAGRCVQRHAANAGPSRHVCAEYLPQAW